MTRGLEIRSVEIANLRSMMNRIINEQRFNQHLATTQKRTEVFVDMPREEIPKPILDKQNVQIIKENFSKKE